MPWSLQLLAERGYVEVDGRLIRRETLAPPEPPPPVAEPTPGLSARALAKLQPEQRLQIDIVAAIRPRLATCNGKVLLLGGELPGRSRLFRLWQFVRGLMGYEVGQPDLLVLWPADDGCRFGLLENKRPRGDADLLGNRKPAGQLSTEQRAFRDWCRAAGAPWAMPRSVGDALAVLDAWGVP